MSQIYKTQHTASYMNGLTAYFNPALNRTYTTGSDYCYDMLNHAEGDMSNANYHDTSIILNNSSSLFLTQSYNNGYGKMKGDYTFNMWFKPNKTGRSIISQGYDSFQLHLTKSHQVYLGIKPSNNFKNVSSLVVTGSELWVGKLEQNNLLEIMVFDTDTLKLIKSISCQNDDSLSTPFRGAYTWDFYFSGSYVFFNQLHAIIRYDKDLLFNVTMSGTDKDYENVLNLTYGTGDASSGYSGFNGGMEMDDDYFWFSERRNDRVQKWTRDGSYVTHSATITDPYGMCGDDNYLYVPSMDNTIRKLNKSDLTIVWTYGSHGSNTNQFGNPWDIVCDDTYLYIADSSNDRIKKHLKSDGSYVSMTGSDASGDYNLNYIYKLAIDDTYIYTYCRYGFTGPTIKKFTKDLKFVKEISGHDFTNDYYIYAGRGITLEPDTNILHKVDRSKYYKRFKLDGHGNLERPHYQTSLSSTYYDDARGLTISGSYVYIGSSNHTLSKWNISDMSFSGSIGTMDVAGDTDTTFNRAEITNNDGTYLYVNDYINKRIKKHRMDDLSYVGQINADSGDYFLDYSRSLFVSGSYIYASVRGAMTLKIFNKDDLSWVTTSAQIHDTYKFETGYLLYVDNDYVYTGIYGDEVIYKLDKTTLNPVYSSSIKLHSHYVQGDTLTYYEAHNMVLHGDYFYIADSMQTIVIDKENLSFVNRYKYGIYTMVSPDTITTGSWHNVTVTVDNSSIRLYLDNIYQTSRSLEDTTTTDGMWFDYTSPLQFGYFGNEYNDIEIGEIRVYNKKLSDTEISASNSETYTRYYK